MLWMSSVPGVNLPGFDDVRFSNFPLSFFFFLFPAILRSVRHENQFLTLIDNFNTFVEFSDAASVFLTLTASFTSFTADFTWLLCLYCCSCPFFLNERGSERCIFFSSLIWVLEDSPSYLYIDSSLLSMMVESLSSMTDCWRSGSALIVGYMCR